MNIPVAHARAQLTQAEAAEAEERRAQLIDRLKSTRADLRKALQLLNKMKKQIEKGQADRDNVRAEIVRYSDALAMVQAQKPAVADHLPDDPESIEWRKKCTALEDALEVFRARRVALPNIEVLRAEGVQLAKRVQELQFSESNILNALDGSIAQSPVGGVFSV